MEIVRAILVCGLPLVISTLSVIADVVQPAIDGSRHLAEDTLQDPLHRDREPATWGLKDTSAVVGMIFRYEIPAEAFAGPVLEYYVRDAEDKVLASWLQFNSTSRTLEGVPSTSDLNRQSIYRIQVEAKLSADKYVKDTFSVSLREHSVYLSDAKILSIEDVSEFPDVIFCPQGASVTSASVVIDADVSKLNAMERVNILKLLGNHLGLSGYAFRYVTLTSNDIGGVNMIDSSALVAGPGDVIVSNSSQVSGVRWEVGCGSVVAPHMNILQILESSAKDGSLHEAIRHGVVGWYVTNRIAPIERRGAGNRAKRRARLRVMPTPTLARTVSPPTSRPVPTRIIEPSRVSPPKSEQISHIVQPPKSEHRNRTQTMISPTPSRIIEPTRSTTKMVSTAASATSTKVSGDVIQPSVVTISSLGVTKTQALPAKSITPTDLRIESTTSRITTASITTKPTTIPTLPPEPMKRRHRLHVGDILNYSIPQHAFSSFPLHKFLIVGLVLSPGNQPLPRDSWIWYNGIRHVLFGIPEPRDVGKHEYRLIAHDQETNRSETIPFEIIVLQSVLPSSITYETYVALDTDYTEFIEKLEPKVDVGSSIASVYGDVDVSQMSVVRIEKGSVVYGWTNKSLLRQSENNQEMSCPVREIDIIMDRVVSANGVVNPRFVSAMEPYRVLYAGGEGRGVCRGVLKSRRGVVKSSPHDKEPDIQPKTASADSKRVLVIALAIIALAGLIVLVIAIIVCTKKLHDNNKLLKEEEVQNGTSVKKGVPVILAADLEDRPTNGSTGRGKVTIFGVAGVSNQGDIIRGVKPMPPGYGEASGGSPAMTRTDYRQPLIPVEERYSRSEGQQGLQHSTYKQHR